MSEYILTQADYLLRIFIAALCGLVIGYEREARLKMAGIRTHTIIAMAASLMVVVSKYGFFDVIKIDGVSVDASRIAASVVTGIGFLGAGIILNHKRSISGVTTSAGIWATLGIGMAIGAGMWALGIGSTLLLLGIQFFFHKNWRILNGSNAGKILLHMKKGDDTRERIVSALTNMNIQVISTHLNIFDNSFIEVSLSVVFPKDFSAENTMTLMANYPEIASIDL
ncbi:MgtC/SapB family protein [Acutalibacter sp. 1XD8-36]|uniref:MgtC/SapB family protein n=1 Tax=Acutalibacter sp. 1XD8-36 TaxID=2320852 RepID=UPI00141333C8|nr:MgtC/SapB family protein [Acutalibacter sp. 1XD8-36]